MRGQNTRGGRQGSTGSGHQVRRPRAHDELLVRGVCFRPSFL